MQANGALPNLNIGQSGVFFELVSPAQSHASSGWVQDSTATFALDAYDSAYTFHAQARNADGIETDFTAESTAIWTLAKPPRVQAADNAPQPQTWVNTRSFTFQALDLPIGPNGELQYEYMIYKATTDPNYQFDGSETRWTPATIGEQITIQIPDSITNPTGQWYFLFRTVNGNGDRTAPTVPDPWYGIDTTPPQPDPAAFDAPIVGTNFITWNALATSTDPDSGLDPLLAYEWALPGAAFSAGSISTTTANLGANQQYTMRLKLQDRVGNETAEASMSTTTLAFAPTIFPNNVTVSSYSITAQWLSNGNPAGTLFRAQLSQSPTFDAPLDDVPLNLPTGAEFDANHIHDAQRPSDSGRHHVLPAGARGK